MAQTYKRKKDGHYWTTETMAQALADIKISAYGAAKQYGIPESTLRRHLKASSGQVLKRKRRLN